MKTAAYYTTGGSGTVRCELCPHHCTLSPGQRGICLGRQNIDGVLISLTYNRPVSVAVDPIEKKPLYHFYPGSTIFSSGPNGCTFKCQFCQNCEISQEILATREVSTASFFDSIVRSGAIGIAYTYSEPYIWFETIMEIAPMVRQRGLKNVMVTNGFMEPGPLGDLLHVIDAMNIDIKSIRPKFYTKLCKATLGPVLKTCETVKKKCHLEITNLIIPGENDSPDDLKDLVDYIASALGKDTPLHLSRYFPRYRMNTPPTPTDTLVRALEIAREKLDFVYIGNADATDGENTACPSCKKILIERRGYSIRCVKGLARSEGGLFAACPACGFLTNIVV